MSSFQGQRGKMFRPKKFSVKGSNRICLPLLEVEFAISCSTENKGLKSFRRLQMKIIDLLKITLLILLYYFILSQ